MQWTDVTAFRTHRSVRQVPRDNVAGRSNTMVNYYTLEEAARVLQTTPDKLREMANRKEIRAFQDRGTLRFRSQEINEMARAQGLGSDPELQPRETPPAKGGAGRPTVHVPQERIDLDLEDDSDEEVPLGKEKPAKGSSSGSGQPSPRPGVPTSSPFELSSTDLPHDKAKAEARKPEAGKPEDKKGDTDSSSDFELTPYD